MKDLARGISTPNYIFSPIRIMLLKIEKKWGKIGGFEGFWAVQGVKLGVSVTFGCHPGIKFYNKYFTP